jgi:tyrosine-protein kinase Etk/Wzc
MMIENNHSALSTEMYNKAVMNPPPIVPPAPTMVPYEEEMQVANYLDILSDNRWLILKIALAITFIGVAYAFFAKPIYEATMLIHVEEDKPNTSKNMLGDISSLFDVKTAAISEMELLNSRMVIERAVDDLGLFIDVRPKYFPLVGAWLATHQDGLSKPGLFGYGGYVWGAEKMDVSTFYVPEPLQNLDFVVTAMGNGRYRLTQKKWGINLDATVGSKIEAETGQGKLQLLVSKLDANAGAQFFLKYRPKLAVIQDVQNSMTVAEKGKQSGIIGVTMESEDRNAAYDILSEIGKEYIHQNVARKLEEAEKSLAFLDKQLPDLKAKLEKSELDYYQFRNTHGTIDLPEEEKLSLQQNATDKMKRLELEQKKEELLISFTPNHPIIIGINKQIQEMNKEINATADHIKQLPILEEDLLRLDREVKVDTDLYAALLNTAQQLRLVKAGKVSNVRLIDAPMMPEKPARPNRPKIIGLSILLGLFLGLATALSKKMLQSGIDDPRKIEQMLGVRVVYATIPHSGTQDTLLRQLNKKSKNLPILANLSPEDIAIESLRSFRTAFQNSTAHFRNNIMLISGPTAGVGKSFVSVNFATVMASSGKKVLLVDADFRNGYLHKYFGLDRKGGLSESICGNMEAQQAIHRNVAENLDFLSTGSLPPNPSEFLLHRNFGELLQTLATGYDFLIIDPPPILAVSDTLVIAAHAGAVFILTRSGITTDSEINESIKRLNQAGISPTGILFNDLKVRARQYNGYHYARTEALGYST